ncbi:MAG TPA: hypothetical protein DHV16_00890 [Nitrospiraceae bacterium]|nr:MAG: hypothetical protein A2Z82_09060 [Nitrospirae bacterium GWA2_46_11]OGW24167.1 MAG: hypothetical protein A2X55_04370 [Nitrospirae bacterium GWB2_47_37]HCZ10822.1 hypothetical protein [Nitrospiraceae bacterium]
MQGITLWLQIRLQFEMKYKKWKGTDRIKEAEKIAEKLKFDLEKNPTKKDFVNAGLYNVWMALYRHRKKTDQPFNNHNGFDLFTIRKFIAYTEDKEFLKKLSKDCEHRLKALDGF